MAVEVINHTRDTDNDGSPGDEITNPLPVTADAALVTENAYHIVDTEDVVEAMRRVQTVAPGRRIRTNNLPL